MREIVERKQQLEQERQALKDVIPKLQVEKEALEAENADLKAQAEEVVALEKEVAALQQEKEGLEEGLHAVHAEKVEIVAKVSEQIKVQPTPMPTIEPMAVGGASLGERPDGLIVTVTDSGVNSIRESHNDSAFSDEMKLAILSDNSIEIRVESREDYDKYIQFAQSRDIVGNVSPQPSWNKATQYTQEWLAEHNNLEGVEITLFDPYGFMDQFPGLNVVETHREHEQWRLPENLKALEDEDIQRQITGTMEQFENNMTFWTVILPMDETEYEGRTISDLWAEAEGKGSPYPARLMETIKSAISVDYLNGDFAHTPVCGFQLQGDKGQPPRDMNIDISCKKGQNVVMNFFGKLPDNKGVQFMEREADDVMMFGPTSDTGNASIEFADNF